MEASLEGTVGEEVSIGQVSKHPALLHRVSSTIVVARLPRCLVWWLKVSGAWF